MSNIWEKEEKKIQQNVRGNALVIGKLSYKLTLLKLTSVYDDVVYR